MPDFEWDLSDITEEFEKMGKDIRKLESRATKKAAQLIKKALIRTIGRGKGRKYYQHGHSKPYKHIVDDIKISNLKEDEDTLDNIREIKGGKYTHYKWKWLEFGTSKLNPLRVLTRALDETAGEVKDTIDNEIRKELNL